MNISNTLAIYPRNSGSHFKIVWKKMSLFKLTRSIYWASIRIRVHHRCQVMFRPLIFRFLYYVSIVIIRGSGNSSTIKSYLCYRWKSKIFCIKFRIARTNKQKKTLACIDFVWALWSQRYIQDYSSNSSQRN